MTGRRLWVPIVAAALAVGLEYLAIFSVPPLITVYVDDLGFSHAEAGALMSACLAGFLVSSLVSGKLAARYGPMQVVVSGLVLCGAAVLCFPLTERIGPMLVCRLAIGTGGGLVYAPGVTFVTSRLPPSRANIGVGVFLCGLSVGGTAAYFATKLIADALDWRWPSWIFGITVLAGAAVVAGLSWRDSSPAATTSAHGSYRTALASLPMRTLCLSLFAGLFVAYGVFTWIPPYLDESAGFSTGQISLTSALMTLSGIPATFGMGWLADRTGRPLVISALALAIPSLLIVFALGTGPPYAVATAIATVSALGVTGGLAPLYALPPVLFGAAAATASGLAAAAAMGGAVASTYLGGWLVGAADGYGPAFWIYAVAAAATSLVLVPLIATSLRRPGPAT
jgi:predicted MFS family arabinose efflux permease